MFPQNKNLHNRHQHPYLEVLQNQQDKRPEERSNLCLFFFSWSDVLLDHRIKQQNRALMIPCLMLFLILRRSLKWVWIVQDHGKLEIRRRWKKRIAWLRSRDPGMLDILGMYVLDDFISYLLFFRHLGWDRFMIQSYTLKLIINHFLQVMVPFLRVDYRRSGIAFLVVWMMHWKRWVRGVWQRRRHNGFWDFWRKGLIKRIKKKLNWIPLQRLPLRNQKLSKIALLFLHLLLPYLPIWLFLHEVWKQTNHCHVHLQNVQDHLHQLRMEENQQFQQKILTVIWFPGFYIFIVSNCLSNIR